MQSFLITLEQSRLAPLFPGLLFLLMAGTVLHKGPVLGGDSHTYLAGAERLLDGTALEGVQRAYPGYVSLLAAVEAVGLSLHWVVFVQLALAALATRAVFSLARSLGGSVAGLVAAILFVGNPDLARWHGYILTESAYISFVLLTSWSAHKAWTKGGGWLITAPAVAALASTIRPTGWLLLPVVVGFLIARVMSESRLGWLAAMVGGLAVAAVMILNPTAQDRIEIGNPSEKISNGVVIPGYKPGWIEMPAAPPGQSTLTYLIEHPVAVARLALTRVVTEFSGVRPFYSRGHNLFLSVLLGAVYLTAAVGWFMTRRESMTLFISIVVLAHVGFVAAAFASYDGRFLLYTFPLLGILCGRALARGISHLDRRDSKPKTRLKQQAPGDGWSAFSAARAVSSGPAGFRTSAACWGKRSTSLAWTRVRTSAERPGERYFTKMPVVGESVAVAPRVPGVSVQLQKSEARREPALAGRAERTRADESRPTSAMERRGKKSLPGAKRNVRYVSAAAPGNLSA